MLCLGDQAENSGATKQRWSLKVVTEIRKFDTQIKIGRIGRIQDYIFGHVVAR